MMSETDFKIKEAPVCPHCKATMEKMDARHLDWESPYLWVCFNNDCTLFKKGWDHMMESMGQLVSYRFMIHPQDGQTGVIPAFSNDYLLSGGKTRNPNYDED